MRADRVAASRLTALRNDLFWTPSWDAALPVATRLIADYPGDAKDHYWRARIHQQLGRVAEARDDYRMAAAMGDDLALQELVMANIRGGLGITAKSFDEVVVLCRLPGTPQPGALSLAERIREEVNRVNLRAPSGSIALSMSAGLCESRPGDHGIDDVVRRADAALSETVVCSLLCSHFIITLLC